MSQITDITATDFVDSPAPWDEYRIPDNLCFSEAAIRQQEQHRVKQIILFKSRTLPNHCKGTQGSTKKNLE